MQKDKLEKYETEPSVYPRQVSRSLAKLPRVQRRWPKRLLTLAVLALMAVGLWLILT